MKTESLDNIIAQWTSIGAGFNTQPASGPVDLERLLLDTARHASGMSRLFIMAATWLHTYGDLVAKHRLKRLIRDELEVEYRPVLGLLLDIAQQGTHPLEFQTVTKTLEPALVPTPLFDIDRTHPKLAERSSKNASAISKSWNLWCTPFEFKNDALRPASWLMARHPEFITRADFRGDLRASILASLQHDEGAGHSEQRLAQVAGGSRAQTIASLRNLELTGRVRSMRAQRGNRREHVRVASGDTTRVTGVSTR